MFKCKVRYWWWERASYENHSVHTCLVSPVLPAGAGPVVLEHLRKKVFLSKSDNILIIPLESRKSQLLVVLIFGNMRYHHSALLQNTSLLYMYVCLVQ